MRDFNLILHPAHPFSPLPGSIPYTTSMYYEVLVASQAYHGSEALTYASDEELPVGALVKIALRNRPVLGLVVRAVPKPDFSVKPITAIAPFPPVPTAHLKLLEWLKAYYPAPLGTVVRQFVPPDGPFKQPPDESPSRGKGTAELPPLSPDQKNALQIIHDTGTFLLHGRTGSGKSRVYVELAQRALAEGKSAIVLTPEIGLTAQLTRTFRDAFGSDVFVLHSQLTAAERRTAYLALLGRERPSVVIGPRSALFSPLRDIGLIVLDEAHDNAYKSDSAPHYEAGRVAAKLAELHQATLVLGSATPAVGDYYLAEARNRPIVNMRELAKPTDTQLDIKMVDVRKSELFSHGPLLSDTLLQHIRSAMHQGEQSLVFLNRRGTANVVLCSNCGWQSLCPNCDVSLTYHGDVHELRCHICGFTAGLPVGCPVCGSTEILFKSVGTKAVVDALQKALPGARIQRFDTDAKKAERLEQHLENITAGGVDIIVGTQMVGKGLDLPMLSVVGIVNADSSLLIPDYTAGEQTYQLISQVVGRVGRGHRPGTVIVQTYDPENTTLHAAVYGNWQEFYDNELRERKAYRFPPFVHLLKLRVLRASSKSAEKSATELAGRLAEQYPEISVEGPAPSFHPRERTKYSWQLLIKSPSRSTLVDIIGKLPANWNYDIDPSNLL